MTDYYTPGSYSIVFHTAEAYKFAISLDLAILDYCVFDEEGIELFWHSKAKRDKAIHILDKEYGISVDWFDFE